MGVHYLSDGDWAPETSDGFGRKRRRAERIEIYSPLLGILTLGVYARIYVNNTIMEFMQSSDKWKARSAGKTLA
jgi:hypothetical protein